MIVCICRRVSERDIHRAAREGVPSFDEMQAELGVATACGACLDCAREAWSQACRGAPCASAGPARSGGSHVSAAARRVVALQPQQGAAYPR